MRDVATWTGFSQSRRGEKTVLLPVQSINTETQRETELTEASIRKPHLTHCSLWSERSQRIYCKQNDKNISKKPELYIEACEAGLVVAKGAKEIYINFLDFFNLFYNLKQNHVNILSQL